MPEGQVSHRNALRFTAALAGATVRRVEAPDPHVAPQRLPERLTGDTVATVEAVGKHHLFRFASGRVLHSHLGMNGSWRLLQTTHPPRTARLWLALWTDHHVAAQYGGPRLRLYEPGEPILSLRAVGPDLLDGAVDPGIATAEALTRVDPGRAIGEALMDQRIVSGIGNVYRSETLFLCGVDPWKTVGDVSAAKRAELGTTGSQLLADGVRRPGPIATYIPSNPSSRERTWVYGRRNRPCRRCGTPIRSRGMGDANRTVYWCPTCQN